MGNGGPSSWDSLQWYIQGDSCPLYACGTPARERKKLKLMAETELVWPLPRARTRLSRTLTFSLALVWLWFCLQNLLLGSYLIDWEKLYCSILCGPCGRLRNLKGSLRKGREKGLSKQVSRNQVWVCEPLSGVKTKSLKIKSKHIFTLSLFQYLLHSLQHWGLLTFSWGHWFLGLEFLFPLSQVITGTPWQCTWPYMPGR